MNLNSKGMLGLVLLSGWLTVGLRADTNTIVPLSELKPGPDDKLISLVAASVLERAHYSRHRLDDDYSSKMFDQYLKMLDPLHLHFLQADLDGFELYRTKLDDLILRRGDTFAAYEIFARFRERLQQRTEYCVELLKTEKFTFTGDERFLINRKDAPAPKDLDEAKQLWRDRLRYEYLQEKLAKSGDKKSDKKKPEVKKSGGTNGTPAVVKTPKPEAQEISEVLTKRYRRILHLYEEMDRDDVFEFFMNALARVYDPHTDYMGKPSLEQFKINMNLALFGIGAQLRADEDGYCNIEKLMPEGPAAKGKDIKEKDRIVAVAQGTNAPVDIIGMNLNKAVQLIRGPKGSEVRLTVEGPDGADRRVVALIRDEIPIESQQAKGKVLDLPGANGQPTRVGVIDLPSFYASFDNSGAGKSEPRFTSSDVAALIKKMKTEGVRGIVLDLRRNGGGSLEEAVKLTGLFIKQGPVVQVKGPDDAPMVDSDEDPSVIWDGPLVVLTSRFSASASEIVAAALQDYGRAVIVGDIATHGKGTVQSLNQLRNIPQLAKMEHDPGALKFTIRKFYRANGRSTQFEGVTPDLVLPSVMNVVKDAGEKALDYALPCDTIDSAEFQPVNRVAPYLNELKKNSSQRVAKSKDFAYVREDIENYLKHQQDKTVSLNEKVRLKEKAEDDARQKARNKERLARKAPEPKVYELTLKNLSLPGLPPPVAKTNSVAATTTSTHSGSVDPLGAVPDEEEKAPELDPTLDEAQAILVDYLQLLDKVVTARKD
jgi:carboxyl-terminal processing protease